MQGRMVDIDKLRATNEDVRAVGNMNVNARGDVLGPGGTITATKEKVIAKYYEQPRGMVDDTPARAKPTPPRRVAPAPQPKAVESKPAPQPRTRQAKPKATPKKGIDAALDGIE
tara:strand:+ start:357 stop:698 length:342 start_codon:yes stop_codon:yes gene_type:complete